MFLIMPSAKVRKNAKIGNRYNQVPHQNQDIEWESDEKQENITHRRDKNSSLSHQVTTKLQDTGSTICQDKPKSTKEVLLWNVSKKSTGVLKIVSKFHKLFPMTEQNGLLSL